MGSYACTPLKSYRFSVNVQTQVHSCDRKKYCASLCPAIQRQRKPSTAWFGAPKASPPTRPFQHGSGVFFPADTGVDRVYSTDARGRVPACRCRRRRWRRDASAGRWCGPRRRPPSAASGCCWRRRRPARTAAGASRPRSASPPAPRPRHRGAAGSAGR